MLINRYQILQVHSFINEQFFEIADNIMLYVVTPAFLEYRSHVGKFPTVMTGKTDVDKDLLKRKESDAQFFRIKGGMPSESATLYLYLFICQRT
jgi:hypothetical protein